MPQHNRTRIEITTDQDFQLTHEEGDQYAGDNIAKEIAELLDAVSDMGHLHENVREVTVRYCRPKLIEETP